MALGYDASRNLGGGAHLRSGLARSENWLGGGRRSLEEPIVANRGGRSTVSTHDDVDAHLSTRDHGPPYWKLPLVFFGSVLALWIGLWLAVCLLV